MATIRKRGDKWQVIVRRKGVAPLARSFTYKADADEWARHMETQADRRGLPPDPRELDRITIADVLERYRDDVVTKKRACAVETIILNAMLRQGFVHMTLADMTPSIFATYRDMRLRTVKPVTINRELALIRHAFDIAVKEWDIPIPNNPLSSVRRPKIQNRRERRLYPDELDALLTACAASRNTLLRPLILFALETGMRRGELLRLRWDHILWDKRTLRIPITKNGCPRTIPISTRALSVLEELRPQRVMRADAARVFPTTEEAVKLAWHRLTVRANVDDLHFHDLRHEAVSRLFEHGLSVPEVALISGHKDARMLFRYTHPKAENIVAKLD